MGDGDGLTEIPPFPCASIDPVGAGDAFNAAFLCGILEGKDVADQGKTVIVEGIPLRRGDTKQLDDFMSDLKSKM